jgi:hypothetical protein
LGRIVQVIKLHFIRKVLIHNQLKGLKPTT